MTKTNATLRREAQCENIERWHQEIPLYNALPSIESLKLVRIPLQSKDRNDHRHTAIDPTKTYLCCEGGQWFMGQFSAVWFGWIIRHGWSSSQLGNIDVIYEIQDLPEIPKQLIERVPVPPEEEDGDE